jgi:RNA polymerase sigma factor (sigma-70 family)
VSRAPADLVLDHIRAAVGPDAGPADAQLLERFAARGEEAAFSLLLRRHGRLVWGVCRRILDSRHDAEDAFQAAFLVLARRAGSVRKQSSVGSWLYGVASRLSWQLPKRRARRAAGPVADAVDGSGQPEPHEEVSLREALAVLDEEVAGLPQKYRAPVVLCHLQGKTTEEAARDLGWPVGTLKTRLLRARELLRGRLERRGITAPAGALTALAAAEVADAAVPAALTRQALGAAVGFAGRGGAAVSPEALRLAQGLLGSALLHRLAWWALGLLALGVLGGRAAVLLPAGPASPPAAPAVPPGPAAAARPAADLHGDPLPAGALARLGTTRFRHGARVWCVSVSPDGKLLATAGRDGNVRLWDVATGREVGVLAGERINLCCVAFSPDGRALAAGDEQAVRVWDVARRRVVWEQQQPRGQSYLAFAPDGASLTAAGPDGGVRRRDAATGKPLQEGAPPPIPDLYGAAPLRGGKAVVAATFVCRGPRQGDAQLTWELHDSATGKPLRRIATTGGPGHTVWSASHHHGQLIALSSDDATLAAVCGYRGNAVALYDVATGKEERRLEIDPDEARLSCVALAPGGKLVAAGGDGGKLYLWERKTGRQSHAVPAHPVAIRAMAFLPGDGVLATAAEDGVVRLWDCSSGKEVGPRGGCLSSVRNLAVTPGGKSVFTGGDEPVVRRWDSATGRELGRFDVTAGGAYGISCSPDGKTLAVADRDYDVGLWDVASGREVRHWKTGPDHNATQVAFAPDGKALASGGVDGGVRLWDPATGKEVRRMKTGHLYFTERLTFAANGTLLASSNHGVAVRVWEAATGRERLVVEVGLRPASALAFAPDGALLAAGCQDGRVRVFATVPDGARRISLISMLEGGQSGVVQAPTAKEVHRVEGPGEQGCAVAFSPDGRLLATGDGGGVVHLWDVASWRRRGLLRGHKGAITDLAFLPGGRLVSASADTTVLVWDVAAAP